MGLPDKEELIIQATQLAIDLHSWRVLSGSPGMTPGPQPPNGLDVEKVEEAEDVARQELQRPFVKLAVCAALKSATADIFDTAKIVVTVLIPLSLAGAIAVPPTPLALAVSAVIIIRAGIATFCADTAKSDG